MKRDDKSQSEDFDIEDLKSYMKLTPEQKLDYLEKLVRFLDEITPRAAKENWQKLKALGY